MDKELKLGLIIIYVILILSTIIAPTFVILQKNESYSLIVKPIIWICLFFLCVIYTLNEYARVGKKFDIIKNIFIISMVYVIIYYLTGIFFGFKNSPLSHTFYGFARNIWSMLVVIVLQEYVRTALLNSNNSKFAFISITIIFILISMNFQQLFDNMTGYNKFFEYLISTVIPLICTNFLCSYLCKNINYIASLAYILPNIVATIIFPVISDVNWFLLGISEIILAYIIYDVVKIQLKKENLRRNERLEKNSPVLTSIFIAFIVVFVLFVTGSFSVSPIAILSNSMYPVFSRGDVVIVQKLKSQDYKKLKVGDIIQYEYSGKYIIHRVHKIVDLESGIFVTKGDNNNDVDIKQVKKDQIVGIAKLVVPTVGYPSVWFGEFISGKDKVIDIELGN